MDENNTDVITWEKLMLTYQQVISNTKQDGKWALGKQIFKL